MGRHAAASEPDQPPVRPLQETAGADEARAVALPAIESAASAGAQTLDTVPGPGGAHRPDAWRERGLLAGVAGFTTGAVMAWAGTGLLGAAAGGGVAAVVVLLAAWVASTVPSARAGRPGPAQPEERRGHPVQ